MKVRAFIDTNVFIYAYEYQNSNSAFVINLINQGEIEAIISERVFNEVLNYFEKHYSLQLIRLFRKYMLETCIIVTNDEILEKLNELKGKINDKDLEQLAVARHFGIKYLIAYDRDFLGFEEYKTPKEFMQLLGLKFKKEEY